MVAGALRSAGLLGGRSDISEPTEEEIKATERENKLKEIEEEYEYNPSGESKPRIIAITKKSNLQMNEEQYESKKQEYNDKMKRFKEKKILSDKDLEKNL
jgi:hypothetical protein